MFIKKITSKGRTYYYIVESKRTGKKIKHKILKYLGTAENLLDMLGKKKK